jgi:hypothetical protein
VGVTFEAHERGAAVVYGECGAIWVMTLHAKPSRADMELARPSLQKMRERHRDGFPTLTWVLPSAGLSMDSDARDAAAKVTREYDASISSMATVVEGEGFGVAAVRAIVAGIDLLSRSRAPKRTFADLAQAVAWCCELRPTRDRGAGAVDRVVAAIAAMRDGITERQ